MRTKSFLQTHVPREVIHRSQILLDTLLNYLMAEAREKLSTTDLNLQNAFLSIDLRNRIHEWASQTENKLLLEPRLVGFTADPRIKQGLITSGIIFVAGTIATAATLPSIVGPIITGVATILLSVLAFRIAFDLASPRAYEFMIEDIDRYLTSAQEQVRIWLETIDEIFLRDFSAFCHENGISIETQVNE